MPVTGLTFGIEPLPENTQFVDLMEGIGIRLSDFVPVYEALYGVFRKIEQDRFNKEGPGWAALAPSTVAQRESLGYGGGHPILKRTGALRRSLTTKGAKDAVVEPIPDGLFMGTSNPVARYHQDGTHGAGRDHNVSMPARPVVDMTEADAEAFSKVISEYVFDFGLKSHTTTDASAMFEAESIGL